MKLVPDRIPELAASTGQPVSFHLADPDEFARRLRDKLLEEAHEAAAATEPAALLEELGDVLQVLYALASEAAHSPAEVECARARKARTHGAYTRRLIWHLTQPEPRRPNARHLPAPASPSPPRSEFPMAHNTNILLMLKHSPTPPRISSHRHDTMPELVYLVVEDDHGDLRISVSGTTGQLAELLDRLGRELVIHTASQPDPAGPEPATTS
jgi:predicted house-cleaning noncanonical NTP pyrophosphatase (MazG superfamily)